MLTDAVCTAWTGVFFGWGAAYKCFHCWVHWLFTVILTVGKDEVSGPDDSSAVRRVQRHNVIKMLCIYTDKYMLHFYTMWRLYFTSQTLAFSSAPPVVLTLGSWSTWWMMFLFTPHVNRDHNLVQYINQTGGPRDTFGPSHNVMWPTLC